VTNSVQTLAGLGLDAHLAGANAQSSSELFLHAGDVGSELGALKPDRGVDVHNRVTGLVKKLADLAKKQEARSVAPLGRGVGEVLADIAQRRGAQERVADCVGQGVAIGMAHRAFFESYPHATQNQLPPRGQTMEVSPDPDAARILNSECCVLNCS